MTGSAEATSSTFAVFVLVGRSCFAGCCCSFSFDDSDETVASLLVAAVGVLSSMAGAGAGASTPLVEVAAAEGTSAPWGWEEAVGRIEVIVASTAVSADIAGAEAVGGIVDIIAIVADSASAADVGGAAVDGMGAPHRNERPGAAVVAATVDGGNIRRGKGSRRP